MKESSIRIYWFVTDIFLAIGLLVVADALYLAMAVTALHSVHFLLRAPQLWSFPMQVRLGFLGLLVLGQAPYLGWVNWVQLAGTTALLTVGYCPLARILCLLPWNRSRPLSWKLVVTVIFSPPVDGSVLQLVSAE